MPPKLAKRVRKWLNDPKLVCPWLDRRLEQAGGELPALLEAGGGIVKLQEFLPPFVADGILQLLQALPDAAWNETSAEDDYAANNIRHSFLSIKAGLDEVFRVFTLLMPESLWTFSAAKYMHAGHIVPHDDRAYTQVLMEDGSIQLCSRDIALIYYLTKDWVPADGGALVDLEAAGGPQEHLPAFNSAIAFAIPRWHEVKPVTGARPRFSIFGWFLQPGRLYELNAATSPQQQADEQAAEADELRRCAAAEAVAAAAAAGSAGQQPGSGRKRRKGKQKQRGGPGQAAEAAGELVQQQQQQQRQRQRQPGSSRKKHKQQQQQQQQQQHQQKQQLVPLPLAGGRVAKQRQHNKKHKLKQGRQRLPVPA